MKFNMLFIAILLFICSSLCSSQSLDIVSIKQLDYSSISINIQNDGSNFFLNFLGEKNIIIYSIKYFNSIFSIEHEAFCQNISVKNELFYSNLFIIDTFVIVISQHGKICANLENSKFICIDYPDMTGTVEKISSNFPFSWDIIELSFQNLDIPFETKKTIDQEYSFLLIPGGKEIGAEKKKTVRPFKIYFLNEDYVTVAVITYHEDSINKTYVNYASSTCSKDDKWVAEPLFPYSFSMLTSVELKIKIENNKTLSITLDNNKQNFNSVATNKNIKYVQITHGDVLMIVNP